MKEKIKLMLLGAFIFYVIGIIGLIIYNGSNYNDTFYINDNPEFAKKITLYKQKLSKMEDNSCNKSISNLIDYYEKTNYSGNVKYSTINKLMFNNSENNTILLSHYDDIKKACKLNDETIEKYNFNYLFLSGSLQFDEIMKDNYFAYELSFKDSFFRSIAEPSITNYEYAINRNATLTIISNLIEISSKDGVNNEK